MQSKDQSAGLGADAVLANVVTITSGQFSKIIAYLLVLVAILVVLIGLLFFLYRQEVNSKPQTRMFAVTEQGVLKELIGSPYVFANDAQVGRVSKGIIEDLFTFTFRELQDGSFKEKIAKYFIEGDQKVDVFVNYINQNWAERVAKNVSFVTAYGLADYPVATNAPIMSSTGDQRLHILEYSIEIIEDVGRDTRPPKERLTLIVEIVESDALSTPVNDQFKIVQIKFKNI